MVQSHMKQFSSSFLTVVFLFMNMTIFSQEHKKEITHRIQHKNMNKEIVMIVTSTGKDSATYIRSRIIPSARTWMKQLANVYVILEDTFALRFSMRHCEHSDRNNNMTSFTCPDNEPVYVLSRRCSSEYYNAESACCKFDEGINFIKSKKDVYDHMKYLFQGDDDVFWRVDQLVRWLAVVDESVSHSLPIVANADSSLSPEKVAGDAGGVWHIKGCNEIHGNGWYQPLMMNKAAVELISVGTSKYGATETCTAFKVSQDVGLPIFFWLYKLTHIKMPGLVLNGKHKGVSIFRPDQMTVHDIKHTDQDDCEGKNWPFNLKHDQAVSIGCGKIGTSSPFHNSTVKADMYDAFEYFAKNGANVSVGNEEVFLRTLNGYETTQHSKQYDITKEWKNFTLDDCLIQGSIDNRRNLRER